MNRVTGVGLATLVALAGCAAPGPAPRLPAGANAETLAYARAGSTAAIETAPLAGSEAAASSADGASMGGDGPADRRSGGADAGDYRDRLVNADDPVMGKPAEAEEPGWRRFGSVYGWLPNFKGDVELEGVSSDVHLTRSDLWNNLDLAFTGRIELLEPGREWSVWMDVFYAGLKGDDSADFAVPVGPATVNGQLEVDADITMTFVEVGTILHALQSERTYRTRALGDVAVTSLDLLGGVRYGAMDVDVDVSASAVTPAGTVAKSGGLDHTERWADPFIGLRTRHLLTHRFAFVVRADIGGFGVGSDLVWNTVATLQYGVGNGVLLGVGWKTIDIDYESTDFTADVRMGGPFVTVTFEF